MMNKFVLVIFIALTLLSGGCASTDGAYRNVFGDSNIITKSLGGDSMKFEDAATDVLTTGRQVVIDGVCSSACVRFAELARPNVCITPRSIFRLHKGNSVTTMGSSGFMGTRRTTLTSHGTQTPRMSPEIKSLVEKKGGLPDGGAFVTLSYQEVSQYWRTCQ